MLTHQIALRSLTTAALSLVAAAGCTSPDSTTGPDPDEADTTAPQIATTVPAASATGVAGDTSIVITFSEPMDPGTVESAYSSPDLPADAVSFSWNTELTVLTIHPDAGLSYAEGIGTDPSAVAAKLYSVSIGAGAADLAGNTLGAPLALSFSTKKRMVASVGLDTTLTRVALGGTLLGSSNDIWIGDNAVDNTYRSYLTFDLAALPTVSSVEHAQFSARQLAPTGLPYGNLGGVVAAHMSFATLNGLGALAPLSVPGMFSQDGTSESKSIDVTAQVADDVVHRAERSNHSQYRLQIDVATNGDATTDKAAFSLGTFDMTIVYIAD